MKNLRNNSITGIYESNDGLSDVSIHFSEWWNGEGMDFTFNEKKNVSLHIDELHGMFACAVASGMVDLEEVIRESAELKDRSKEREEALEILKKAYL